MQHDDDWPGHDDWPARDDALWVTMRFTVGLPIKSLPPRVDPPRPNDTRYLPYVSKEELEGDLSLVAGLFDGLSRDDKGVTFATRIKPGGRDGPSLDEQKARDALARLLKAGTWNCGEWSCGEACRDAIASLYWDLASLIESGSAGDALELVLRRRPGPKAPQPNRLDESIAQSLVSRVYGDGWPVEAAVADVKDKHGVSEKTVWNIWTKSAKNSLETEKFVDDLVAEAEAGIARAEATLQTDATSLQRDFDDN
jgi:hypothetical protein